MGKKKAKTLNVVSFDEETVPKNVAEQILANGNESESREQKVAIPESVEDSGKKKKKKKKKWSSDENVTHTVQLESQEENDTKVKGEKMKKRTKQVTEEVQEDEVKPKKKRKKIETEAPEETDPNNPTEPKKKDSIREQKRKKFAKLLEEKKLKSDLALQQKSLEYLSKWKHCRNEWKFEKLRQIWLQHNMYDSAKIPQEFWETLVEYLSNAKGKAKEAILKDAVKIIEESTDDSGEAKINRARDVVQSLQE